MGYARPLSLQFPEFAQYPEALLPQDLVIVIVGVRVIVIVLVVLVVIVVVPHVNTNPNEILGP